MRLAGLALAFVLGLSACQNEPVASQEGGDTGSALVLGFSQLGSESAWRTGNTRSIQQAAEKAGVQLMFNNAQQKQENQIKAIRSYIAYRVDVIAFAPIVEDGWDSVLSEAKEAGIPVLLCDRMIETSHKDLYAGFIGSDFYQEGIKAGHFLLKKTNGQIRNYRIAELSGTAKSSPMRGRYEGFREAIAGDRRFEIVCSLSGDFLRSKGKQRMKQILDSYGDIDVLYSHNDSMTLGAIEAMEEAGVVPGVDVIVISVDGEQGAIDALKAGKINCVVECTPLMGDKVIDLAKQLAAGESIPEMSYNEERVFSEYDDLRDLAPRGY